MVPLTECAPHGLPVALPEYTMFGTLKNASPPMLVTELGMITDVKLQLMNALLPMLITEFGIITEVNLIQPENAELPISVTEFGMATEVKLTQSSNA